MPSANLDRKEHEVTELGTICKEQVFAITMDGQTRGGHIGQCVKAEQATKQEHQTSDEGGSRINPCKLLFVQ